MLYDIYKGLRNLYKRVKGNAPFSTFAKDTTWVFGWLKKELPTDDEALDIVVGLNEQQQWTARRWTPDLHTHDGRVASPDISAIYFPPCIYDEDTHDIMCNQGKSLALPVWSNFTHFLTGYGSTWTDTNFIEALKSGITFDVRLVCSIPSKYADADYKKGSFGIEFAGVPFHLVRQFANTQKDLSPNLLLINKGTGDRYNLGVGAD